MGSGSPDVTTVLLHEVFTFEKWWRLQVPEEWSAGKGSGSTGAQAKLIQAHEMPQFSLLFLYPIDNGLQIPFSTGLSFIELALP